MAFKNCESTYGDIKQTKHKKVDKNKKRSQDIAHLSQMSSKIVARKNEWHFTL